MRDASPDPGQQPHCVWTPSLRAGCQSYTLSLVDLRALRAMLPPAATAPGPANTLVESMAVELRIEAPPSGDSSGGDGGGGGGGAAAEAAVRAFVAKRRGEQVLFLPDAAGTLRALQRALDALGLPFPPDWADARGHCQLRDPAPIE